MNAARALTALLLSGALGLAQAQWVGDPNWKEGPTPEPPAFSVDRLVQFPVNADSALVYGIDPQTLSISAVDRVVRYVVVVRSPSGARNVFFEGIRCPTGEMKTYARHTGQVWVSLPDPQWVPMQDRPSRHTAQLARQGACTGAGTPARPDDILRALRQTSTPAGG
jgi:hypothetical protein